MSLENEHSRTCILASMEVDMKYVLIVPVLMVLLIISGAIAATLKHKGMIQRGTPMWKFYVALRILPGILGVSIAAFVLWLFLSASVM